MQLRQVVVELGLVQVRTQVLIPKVFAAFGDDDQPVDAMHAKTASALLDEVADWALTLRTKRDPALEGDLAGALA